MVQRCGRLKVATPSLRRPSDAPMSSIVEQLTALYVFTDDFLKTHPAAARWRRSPNAHPVFTDAEVITIGLMQSALRVAALKHAYRLIAESYPDAFPHLPSYAQWLARLHALSPIIGMLIEAAVPPLPTQLYLMDSKPIPVCKPLRHGRVRLLREAGAYFGKSTTGWFFGFKLHLLAHASGALVSAILTPANWQDRAVAPALGQALDGGIAVGDLGYRSAPLTAQLAEEDEVLLLTPADAGARRMIVSRVRQRIETSCSALWHRFVDRVFSRSFTGLWTAIKLKMLHFNLCHAALIPV